ncbi:hypothetical protein D3C75_1231490 [compost metagenome]
MPGAFEQLGFVPFQPNRLRRREAGQGFVAGQLAKLLLADGFFNPGAFRFGTLVAP